MKRFIQFASTLAVSLGLSTVMASAAAVTCGSISNGNGTGSTNTVSCVDTNKVSVSCKNNVVVDNSNNQSSSSGSSTSSGNTTSGGTSSGNSSNSSTATVSVGASCAPVSASSSSFTTAAAGGQGGGAGSPAAGSASNVSSLPETGSNTAVDTAIAGVVGLAGVLAASRVGLAAYRRHALK